MSVVERKMIPGFVLFDAGNTLVDLDFEALAAIFADCGAERDAAALRRATVEIRPALDLHLATRSSTESDDTRALFAKLVFDRLEIPEGMVRLRLLGDLAEKIQDLWTVPTEGADETLTILAERGYRLGVVSNSNGHIADYLAGVGLDGHFETIVDSTLVGIEKPDPEIFRIALARMGAAAGETVYVGDLPSVDVAGAEAAGLGAVLIDPLDVFADRDFKRIRRLAELPRLLDDWHIGA